MIPAWILINPSVISNPFLLSAFLARPWAFRLIFLSAQPTLVELSLRSVVIAVERGKAFRAFQTQRLRLIPDRRSNGLAPPHNPFVTEMSAVFDNLVVELLSLSSLALCITLPRRSSVFRRRIATRFVDVNKSCVEMFSMRSRFGLISTRSAVRPCTL